MFCARYGTSVRRQRKGLFDLRMVGPHENMPVFEAQNTVKVDRDLMNLGSKLTAKNAGNEKLLAGGASRREVPREFNAENQQRTCGSVR